MTHAHILYFLIFSKWKFLLLRNSQQTAPALINKSQQRWHYSHYFKVYRFIRDNFTLIALRQKHGRTHLQGFNCAAPLGCLYLLSGVQLIRNSILYCWPHPRIRWKLPLEIHELLGNPTGGCEEVCEAMHTLRWWQKLPLALQLLVQFQLHPSTFPKDGLRYTSLKLQLEGSYLVELKQHNLCLFQKI